MNRFVSFLSTCFAGGLMVVFPLWLTIVVIGAAISALRSAIHPIGGWIVEDSAHPHLLAALILLLLCFLAGLFVQTRLAHSIGSAIDGTIFSTIPGYRLVRKLLRGLTGEPQGEAWAVALVDFDDATVPAFVVEKLPDGRYAVFAPSVPTPAAGSIFIMEARRVHIVDVSFAHALRSLSQWGVGTSGFVAGLKAHKAGS